MSIEKWLSSYGDTKSASELESPAARLFVPFLERHVTHIAKFVEARIGKDRELIVADFRTGIPQNPAYPIKRIERIGIRFAKLDAMPVVFLLRNDFPDTDHQLLVGEGEPRAICVDDREWSEARLTWNPAELVCRIQSWFSRAAYDELHDPLQPIDPLIAANNLRFIISRDVLSHADDHDLIGVLDPQSPYSIIVYPLSNAQNLTENFAPVCIVSFTISPQKMKRLQFAPNNLLSLAKMLEARGIDLLKNLRERFAAWLCEKSLPIWNFNSNFSIILETPIISRGGTLHNGTDLRAFVASKPVGDIAVALGVAIRAKSEEGSNVGYVRQITPNDIDLDSIGSIAIQSAEVHYQFDRKLATKISGRDTIDERKVVMVGAGAIGSHVADCLVREGRFRWTIIDEDYLLPHNLARHIRRRDGISKPKANLVADDLSETLEDSTTVAYPICANVMSNSPQINQSLLDADLILDATASVATARFLSDHSSKSRRVCIFFNPLGKAVVLLVEPNDRSLTMRELEAQYLSQVMRDEALSGHLDPPEGTYVYTGACRAITNLTPQSRVMALSGLVSNGLASAIEQDGATIRIWSKHDSGVVDVFEYAVEASNTLHVLDWTISIDLGLVERILSMRSSQLPNETGGVLTGIVDIPSRRIQLIDAAPAPPDSKSSPDSFERGTSGVMEYLEQVSHRTQGQVRYVGEWHSHPPGVASLPSPTDLSQLDWLSTVFDIETLPALMLIAGGNDISIILAEQQARPLNKNTIISNGK